MRLNIIFGLVVLLAASSCKKDHYGPASEKTTLQLANQTGHALAIQFFRTKPVVTRGFSDSISVFSQVRNSYYPPEENPVSPSACFKGDSVRIMFDDGRLLIISCQEPNNACNDTLSPLYIRNYRTIQENKQEAIYRFTFWPEHYNRAR